MTADLHTQVVLRPASSSKPYLPGHSLQVTTRFVPPPLWNFELVSHPSPSLFILPLQSVTFLLLSLSLSPALSPHVALGIDPSSPLRFIGQTLSCSFKKTDAGKLFLACCLPASVLGPAVNNLDWLPPHLTPRRLPGTFRTVLHADRTHHSLWIRTT